MRSRGNFNLDQRVVVAVFPLHRFLGGHGGTGQDLEIRGNVVENHVAVVRMDIGLHGREP
ncbi:hypothetical protein D3C72_2559780 [compost metagenome]